MHIVCISEPHFSGHVLAPVKLLIAKRGAAILVNEEEKWQEIEIEVALDSASVCHVVSGGDPLAMP